MVEEVKRKDGKVEKVGEVSPAWSPLVSDRRCDTKPGSVPRRTSGPARKSTKGGWTKEEDELLARAVRHFEGKHWKKIAELFPGRTDVQCLHRWQKVLNPELIKGTWTKEEDDLIIELVRKHGPKRWSEIAKSLTGRIGKQCRERWHNHLNPEIKKDAWTTEEEVTLIRAHQIYGNRWAEISKFLPGRADNSIKNHWNCSLKKRLDTFFTSGVHNQQPGIVSLDLNNYVLRVQCSKEHPVKQSNGSLISPDQKLNADRHVLTSSMDSAHHCSSRRQDLSLQPVMHGDFKCFSAGNQNNSVNDSKGLKVEVKPIPTEDVKCITHALEVKDSESPLHWEDGNVSTNLPMKDANFRCKDDSDLTSSLDESCCAPASQPKEVKRDGSQIFSHIESYDKLYKRSLQSPLRSEEPALNSHNRDISQKVRVTCTSKLRSCDCSSSGKVEDFNQVPSTSLPSDKETFGSMYYAPLHLTDIGGSISCEKVSNSKGCIQQLNNLIHCSTPPRHSLTLACIPTSPESILRNAAKSFKNTPSILRKRGRESFKHIFVVNPPRATVEAKDSPCSNDPYLRTPSVEIVLKSDSMNQHKKNDQVDCSRTESSTTNQFILSSCGNLKPMVSMERRLEAEFNMEWDSSKL